MKAALKLFGLIQEDHQEEKNRVDGENRVAARNAEEIEAERQRKEAKKDEVSKLTDAELRDRAKRLHNRQRTGDNPE